MSMHPHLPKKFVSALADARVLEHRVVELDQTFLLVVRTRARDAKKLREKLQTELSQADKPVTVVLSSSASQDLDVGKWRRARRPASPREAAARLRLHLLA
jgi:hypothetical protein